MKKVLQNLITVAFLLCVFGGFFTTVLFNYRHIISESYKSIKQICGNGVHPDSAEQIVSSFESAYTNNLFGKSYCIEVLGLFNKVSNKKIFMDSEDRYTVYQMKNGQLTWNYSGYDTSEAAEKYVSFAREAQALDIPLLYVQAPFKINKYDNQLPYGIADNTNPLSDHFLRVISDEFDTLDLREIIYNNSMDYSSLFYNTDHHWTAKTGLWASEVIANHISGNYNVELDCSYLDESKYHYTDYENYMLGSQGKRCGLLYSGSDDFVLIEPNYKTRYSLSIPSLNVEKKGDYSETILFKDYLKKDWYEGDPGRVYTGDNYSLMIIENELSSNNTNILLVKDSFSKSVIPSFASVCKELHVIDLRTFGGSVIDYAKENNIDIIVVLYNPSVVVDPDFFEFN